MSGGVYRLNGYNSVRRLNTREGKRGFRPTDITGCKLWLDFSDADTLFVDAGITKVSADGQAIYQANDKSGNGYHISQATLDSRPLYKTGANGINSKSVSLFDGSNDYLFRNVANWLSTDSSGSVFVVFETVTSGDTVSLLTSSDTAGIFYWLNTDLLYDALGVYYARILSRLGAPTPSIVRGDTGIAAGNPYLYLARSSGTAYTLRVNGSDENLTIMSGTNTGDWLADIPNRDNLVVGALIRSSIISYMNGKIAEVIVYNSNLTGSNLTNVETYLNNKWAIY